MCWKKSAEGCHHVLRFRRYLNFRISPAKSHLHPRVRHLLSPYLGLVDCQRETGICNLGISTIYQPIYRSNDRFLAFLLIVVHRVCIEEPFIVLRANIDIITLMILYDFITTIYLVHAKSETRKVMLLDWRIGIMSGSRFHKLRPITQSQWYLLTFGIPSV